MNRFLTVWTLLTFLLGLVIAFVPLGVVAYEDGYKKTTRWSRPCTWLLFHAGDVILLTVACTFAVWRLEHSYSVVAASEYFILPAAWTGGGIFWKWVRKFGSPANQEKA